VVARAGALRASDRGDDAPSYHHDRPPDDDHVDHDAPDDQLDIIDHDLDAPLDDHDDARVPPPRRVVRRQWGQDAERVLLPAMWGRAEVSVRLVVIAQARCE
jgi:hypothetical protein